MNNKFYLLGVAIKIYPTFIIYIINMSYWLWNIHDFFLFSIFMNPTFSFFNNLNGLDPLALFSSWIWKASSIPFTPFFYLSHNYSIFLIVFLLLSAYKTYINDKYFLLSTKANTYIHKIIFWLFILLIKLNKYSLDRYMGVTYSGIYFFSWGFSVNLF